MIPWFAKKPKPVPVLKPPAEPVRMRRILGDLPQVERLDEERRATPEPAKPEPGR